MIPQTFISNSILSTQKLIESTLAKRDSETALKKTTSSIRSTFSPMSRTKSQGLDTCDTQSIILPVVITCSGVVLLTGVLVIALFRKKCNKKIPLHDHELASHQPVKPRSDQSTIYQSIPQEIDYDKCDIPEFH